MPTVQTFAVRETNVSRTANVGTVGKNWLKPLILLRRCNFQRIIVAMLPVKFVQNKMKLRLIIFNKHINIGKLIQLQKMHNIELGYITDY